MGRKLEADASAPKEPERARVPEGKQEREEKTTDNGQRPVWEAVQAHDEHLGGEGAVEGAAEERVGEDAPVRSASASVERADPSSGSAVDRG